MAFCNDCGFLLPADFKSEILLCNPCRESYSAQKPCECDYCGSSSSFIQSNPSSSQSQDSSNTHSTAALQLKTKKPTRNKPKSSSLFDYVHDKLPVRPCRTHRDFQASDDKSSEALDGGTDMKDDDWTVVNKKHHNQTASLSQDLRTTKDDQVSEEIREKWAQEQAEYLKKLIIEDTPTIARLVSGKRRKSDGSCFYIGGVDISFIKNNNIDACASLSVLRMPSLQIVYQRMETIELKQPYIPGFLAFREVPPLATLFEHLKKSAPQFMPDVVMVDGNGILHPRGFGLASQLGVVLDLPTIGVAKTLISAQGLEDNEAHKRKKQTLTEGGHGFDLISQESGGILGRCLRVHDEASNPIYVSIGHKISLSSAEWIVLETSKYRIPEPVRRADLDSREYIRQNKKCPEEFILKEP